MGSETDVSEIAGTTAVGPEAAEKETVRLAVVGEEGDDADEPTRERVDNEPPGAAERVVEELITSTFC